MKHKLPPQRYSFMAIILHWLLAFALAFQMGLGWQIDALQTSLKLFDVMQLHKSIGIVILILSIARLLLRYYKKPPPSLPDEKWLHVLSKITHIALYLFMIGAPLTGWLMVSSSKFNIETYLFGSIYWPHIPGVSILSASVQEIINNLSKDMHEYLGWMGIFLFLLHVTGALRHQYFKNEPLLERILPIVKLSGKSLGSFAIIMLVSLVSLVFFMGQVIEIRGNNAKVSDKKNVTKTLSVDDSMKDKEASEEASQEIVSEDTEKEDEFEIASYKTSENEEVDVPVDEITKEVSKVKENNIPYKWSISGQKSLAFSVKWNGDILTGSFSDWSADIVFSANALKQSSIVVDVQLSSVTTSDDTANGAIAGADFFNVAAFPVARFSSNTITALGKNRYQATGTLRLKNISQPLTINFTLDEKGQTSRAKGSTTIDRLRHKVGDDSSSEIENDVRVTFDFTAKR